LALVGGDEFKPGNEDQDALLAAAAAPRPGIAYVVPTAAARGGSDQAVANATRWFAQLGLPLEELHVLTRTQANSEEVARLAAGGRFFYLVGGDPGHTATTLRESAVWRAIVAAWRGGAALAGSSAGAMAMGEWTLIRDRFKGDSRRQYRAALGPPVGAGGAPPFRDFRPPLGALRRRAGAAARHRAARHRRALGGLLGWPRLDGPWSRLGHRDPRR